VSESVPNTTIGDGTYRHNLLDNGMMPNNMPLLDSYVFDDERWESTFMNAEFHIGEGVFLPGSDYL
jgi:hypothetical protein